MRKRNVSFIADKLLWFIILILPLLFALVFTCASMNNYKLEVNSLNLDGVSYSKYVFDDTYHNTNFYVTQQYDTNVLDSLYYIPIDYTGSITLFVWDESFSIVYHYYSVRHSWVNNDYGDIFDKVDETNYDGFYRYALSSSFASVIGDFGDTIFLDTENDFNPIGTGVYFDLSFSDTDVAYCYVPSILELPSNDNIFNTYFNNLNYSLDSWFTFGENDIVYNAFNSIFGSQSNILPIFVEGSFIPKYLTYMSWIYVLHIAFDFLVFIPRLAHKWMGGVYNDDE